MEVYPMTEEELKPYFPPEGTAIIGLSGFEQRLLATIAALQARVKELNDVVVFMQKP